MIKQPLYAIISLILLVIVAGFAIERITFLRTAERTTGTAVKVTSYNSRCGGRSSHSCTRYTALVEFLTRENTKHLLEISAGSSRGHDQPLNYADVGVNSPVPVVYDPNNPSKAYENTSFGIWGGPIILLILQLGSFFTSLTEPKRRNGISSARSFFLR